MTKTFQVAYTFTGPDNIVRQNVIESVEADSAAHAIEGVRAQFELDLPLSEITYIRAQENTKTESAHARSTPNARR